MLSMLCALSTFAQPPDAAAQQSMLDGVKQTAARYQREVPDFLCTLLTKRFEDHGGSGKKFKQRDSDEVEFRYVGRRAYRTVLKVNNKPAKQEPLTGFRSDGLLPLIGFLPEWLLGPSAKTAFQWLRWDVTGGRRVAVFHLQLNPEDSKLPFSSGRGTIMAGLDGAMYVDPMTSTVIRLELQLQIPPNAVLDVVACSFDLDYGPVMIAGQEFFLPIRTVVVMRNDLDVLLKNETEVVRYQKYAADTSVQFGDPEH